MEEQSPFGWGRQELWGGCPPLSHKIDSMTVWLFGCLGVSPSPQKLQGEPSHPLFKRGEKKKVCKSDRAASQPPPAHPHAAAMYVRKAKESCVSVRASPTAPHCFLLPLLHPPLCDTNAKGGGEEQTTKVRKEEMRTAETSKKSQRGGTPEVKVKLCSLKSPF